LVEPPPDEGLDCIDSSFFLIASRFIYNYFLLFTT